MVLTWRRATSLRRALREPGADRLAVGIQPLVSRWLGSRLPRSEDLPPDARRDVDQAPGLPPSIGGVSSLVGVYGGYFGAGQGIMLVAFLALGLDENLQVVNALKNIAVLSANLAATLIFVALAPLDWAVVALIAVGSMVGGWAGAHVGRRLPPTVFRSAVVVFGYLVGLRLLLAS